jgi:uncharacterized protein YjdB
MKQFKIIAGFILLVQISTSFQTMARERYRIVVKQIEGKIKYIPQTKKRVTGFLSKRWVDVSNQPLSSENEARNYILEVQIVDKQIQQSTIQNFIYIK